MGALPSRKKLKIAEPERPPLARGVPPVEREQPGRARRDEGADRVRWHRPVEEAARAVLAEQHLRRFDAVRRPSFDPLGRRSAGAQQGSGGHGEQVAGAGDNHGAVGRDHVDGPAPEVDHGGGVACAGSRQPAEPGSRRFARHRLHLDP